MKASLVLVDMQNDYLASSRLQPPADTIITQTVSLLNGCRKHSIPVIHVWTTVSRNNDNRLPHWRKSGRWNCIAETHGHRPPKRLRVLENDTVIEKTGFNAFADGTLDRVLGSMPCDTVIIAGLHLHACVRTVATECLERGYQVYIAEDAVGSNDPVHAASTYRWLIERCVVFEPVKSILARLDSGTPSMLVHCSPRFTGDVLFEVPIADAKEIQREVETAQNAMRRWSQTAYSARQQILQTAANRLESTRHQLAGQMAIEIGKPLSHCYEEIHRAVHNIRDTARYISTMSLEKKEKAGIIRYRSLGLVAIITAWNNPVAVPLGKIAPALAFGNTVVWKPAPATTHLSQVILQLLRDSGVPEDSVRLLTGDHTTARKLADHSHVNAVTLTGSVMSGYAIQEICSRRMLPLQAELSGNNASIVWDDADMQHAAREVIWAAFAFAGQRCTANRRVIVHASLVDSLLNELENAANQLVLDDPIKQATDLGPVINNTKRDEIQAIIREICSTNQADRVILTHNFEAEQAWFKAGAYARPAIICCEKPDHLIVQEETMGPLLIVQQANDFDHAMDLCNGVRHGLAASLFSGNQNCQQQFLDHAQAGVLKVNSSTAGVDVSLPFGGWKQSGIGPPEHGEGDHNFYTRIQTVYIES